MLDTSKHGVSETVGIVVDIGVGREDDRLALPLVLGLHNNCIKWRSNRRQAGGLAVVVSAEVYPRPVAEWHLEAFHNIVIHIGVKDSSSLTDLVIVTSGVGGDLLVQRQGHCQRERGETEENGGKENHPLAGLQVRSELAAEW